MAQKNRSRDIVSAPVGRRFAAYAIDLLVGMVVFMFVNDSNPKIAQSGASSLYLACFFGVSGFALLLGRQTVGMGVMKLKLVMRDGSQPSLGICLARAALLALTMLSGILWIPNIASFLTKNRTSWIDHGLKTEVVDDDAQRSDATAPEATETKSEAVQGEDSSLHLLSASNEARLAAPPVAPLPIANGQGPQLLQVILWSALEDVSSGDSAGALRALLIYAKERGNGTPRDVFQLLLMIYQLRSDKQNFERCHAHYRSRFGAPPISWDEQNAGKLHPTLGMQILEAGLLIPSMRSLAKNDSAKHAPNLKNPVVNDAYAQVAAEVAARDFKPQLMSRAEAEAGDDEKAKLRIYMRHRADGILRENPGQ